MGGVLPEGSAPFSLKKKVIIMTRSAFALALLLSACAAPVGYEPIDDMPATDMTVPAVMAKVETVEVESSGDAADDPALWIHPDDTFKSLILGTDKQAGLYSYDLNGQIIQFIPSGALNNVDVRQGVTIGNWQGDLAAATNRSDNTVTLFMVTTEGRMKETGRVPTNRNEPYGICMGDVKGQVLLVVTYKNGMVDIFALDQITGDPQARFVQSLTLQSQLEGCVVDEPNNALYIGEENAGISRYDLVADETVKAVNGRRVDVLGSDTGIVADIEGLTIYRQTEKGGYLIASSQGNNTFAVYDRQSGEFVGRFRVASDESTGIDGAEDTDGIDATSVSLPNYPKGVFVVQDGFNMPAGTTQNYKYIDWRDIAAALDLN